MSDKLDIKQETGVWVSSWWGQYGSERLVDIASGFGFNGNGSDEDANLISRCSQAAADLHKFDNRADLDIVVELADEAEEWLNEHIAPEGHTFGWLDGEFWLMADDDWKEWAC